MRLMQLSIPSDPMFERVARESAAIVARYLHFTVERQADLLLAVSEAVNNAMEHGNGGQREQLVAVRFILSGERLDVCVIDGGGKMPGWHQLARPLLAEKLLDETPRGLGLYLIQQLSDGVEMRSSEGRTEFQMWFYRAAPERAGSGER